MLVHTQEALRRPGACELGPQGVRVATIITGGAPEAVGDPADPAIAQGIIASTMTGRAATYESVDLPATGCPATDRRVGRRWVAPALAW